MSLSRLEALPPPAAGIGNDSASAGKDNDTASNAATSELLAKSDNVPVATEVQSHETIIDTGPEMTARPLADDTLMRSQKLAETGDAKVQNILGAMYATGDGVPNAAKATELDQKSAAQEDAKAQNSLGVIATGDSVPKNADKAAERNQKSAGRRDAKAQNNLEVIATSDGVPRDPAKALDWLQKAAEPSREMPAHNSNSE